MRVGQDKLLSEKRLREEEIPVAKTVAIKSKADIPAAFSELGGPLWGRGQGTGRAGG